tara:strand:+ start:2511 stop:3806 length:1296 start_codon:yes stop_codon:yes gene_type:complete
MSASIKWPIVRLETLAQSKKNAIVGGPFGSNLVSADYVEEGVPVVRGVNLPKDASFSCDRLVFVSESKADSLKQNLATPGDLIFTQRGTLGQVGIAPHGTPYDRFLISQSQMKMSVDQGKCDPRYLYYFFRMSSTVDYIHNHALQSGVPHINLGILRRFEVVCPPVDVQRTIAGVLTAYDDLIENNKRRITLLETMSEEIYREWFVRFRFPGWQEAEFEKGLPVNWQTSGLGQIAKFVMGQSPKSEFYNRNGDGLPFHQGVGTFGKRFPTNEVYCSVSSREAKTGDVLFSVRAPVGRLNIAMEHMVIGRGLSAVRHRRGCQSYLYYLLSTAFSNEDIIGNGAIFNAVGKDELLSFKVLSPPDDLIDAFEKLVNPIDDQIAGLIRQNEVLEKTKNQLLPRLISGKLSVDNLDIQFPPSMQSGESDSADEAAA